jgi:hypothetical protein
MSNLLQKWKNASMGSIAKSQVSLWWRQLPADPWSEEDEKEINSPDARALCHRCFLRLEYEESRWFCANCGTAIGPYNNILPYVRIFSIGEIFRSGVGKDAPFTVLTVIGYLLFAFTDATLIAPFYVFRLLKNIRRKKENAEKEEARRCDRLFKLAVGSTILLAVGMCFIWCWLLGPSRGGRIRTDDHAPPPREATTVRLSIF